MGANITITNLQIRDNEPFGDIAVTSSCLKATSVDSELAPLMIDEFPILAIAASLAEGKSSFYGLKELRYKESDRLHMIYKYLNLLNIRAEIENDNLHIWGTNKKNIPSGIIDSNMDHRIAMSFLTLGLASDQPIYVTDTDIINTSFPKFLTIIKYLGGKIQNG